MKRASRLAAKAHAVPCSPGCYACLRAFDRTQRVRFVSGATTRAKRQLREQIREARS